MTWTLKHRPLPGSPMVAEYECPLCEERFDILVARDENGDPPATALCPIVYYGARNHQSVCGRTSALVISAPSIRFWSRDPVPIGRASRSDEKDPRMLDTEPLATGKMTKAEWKKYQRGISQERRHQKRLKAGKISKRIQVGGG